MFEEDRGFSPDEMNEEREEDKEEELSGEDSELFFNPAGTSFTADLSNEGFSNEHVNGSPSSFFDEDKSIESVLDNNETESNMDNPSLSVVKDSMNPYLNSSPSLDAFVEENNIDNSYSDSYNPSMDVLNSAPVTTEPVPEVKQTVSRKKGVAGKIDRFLSSTLHLSLDDNKNTGRSAFILFIVGFFLVLFTRNSVKLEFAILGFVFSFIAFFKSLNHIREKNFLIVVTFIFSLIFLSTNMLFRFHVQDYFMELFTPVKKNSFVHMAQKYVDKARDMYKTGAIPSIYDRPSGVYYLSELYDESFEKYSPFGNLILLDSSYVLIEEDSSVAFNPVFVYSIYISDGEYRLGSATKPISAKSLKASAIVKLKK